MDEDSMTDFEHYLSPFSWRYGSDAMRRIWGEIYKRQVWRRIWFHLASVQSQYGLLTAEQVQEISQHVDRVDIQRAFEIEAEIHHDLMAELKTFAEQCPTAGGILHLALPRWILKIMQTLCVSGKRWTWILTALRELLLAFASQIERWASTPMMAYTHLQPAEPSTLGYRLASLVLKTCSKIGAVGSLKDSIRGKGFKGAVGTAATYVELLGRGSSRTLKDS
jgi:adenylosuccinate lyase